MRIVNLLLNSTSLWSLRFKIHLDMFSQHPRWHLEMYGQDDFEWHRWVISERNDLTMHTVLVRSLRRVVRDVRARSARISIKSLSLCCHENITSNTPHSNTGTAVVCDIRPRSVSRTEGAIKIVDKTSLKLKEIVMLRKEYNMLRLLDHPRVVSLLDVFENREDMKLVMRKASGGTLCLMFECEAREI